MEKYGFVYLWYDRKHKRFYIGCRWGSEDDGYICSSSWMKQSYKHRPYDFKRRILSKVYTNKKDLLEEEYKWLSLIKDEELGQRYYNLHNHHFGHWSTDKNSRLTVGEKISKAKKGMSIPKDEKWRKNLSKSLKGRKCSVDHANKCRLNGKKVAKKYIIVDKDENLSIIVSLKEFSTNNNLSYSKMHDVSKGRKKSYKGFSVFLFNETMTEEKNMEYVKLSIKDRFNYPGSAKNWLIKHPNGSIEKISNLNQYCRSNNLSAPMLFKTLPEKNNKPYKGYSLFRGV